MRVIGADRVARLLGQLPDKVQQNVARSVAQSGHELVRVAKVLAPVGETGAARADIRGTQNGDGSFLVDFGALSKVLEGGRDDPIASPSGRNIGTTRAQPFVNPALAYTRKKFKARAQRAARKAIKDTFNG